MDSCETSWLLAACRAPTYTLPQLSPPPDPPPAAGEIGGVCLDPSGDLDAGQAAAQR